MRERATLRSRVIALAGIGVLAAGGTLSLFSRQSLLALDASMREARGGAASVTAAVIARDITADLEVLEEFATTRQALPAAPLRRPMRLGHALCYVSRDGSRCDPASAAAVLAHPALSLTIASAVRQRRPAVSPFGRQRDGGYAAIAVVPVEDAASRDTAVAAVIDRDGGAMRAILDEGMTLEADASSPLPHAAVAGTPWTVAVVGRDDGDDPVARFRRRSIWVSPLLAALAVLLASGIAVSVNRPLLSLTHAAERIAAGDLSQYIDGGSDEIGRLGGALEHMRLRLRASAEASARANEELEHRVDERTAQLQRLLGKVISAQEDERRRVARELHDETSQLLAALSMAIHAGPAASSDPRALLERLQDGVHRLIINLRPAVLDDLGLAAAINMLAETQLRRASLSVRCELSELEHGRLAPAVEIAVFRIVQEAILNIVRHSAATTILIQAGMSGEQVWVEIEDDGHGFDLAAIHPDSDSLRGVGLLGMRERTELLGGHFTIESAPGEGTRIRVQI